ncbi:MAG: 3-dehydroquinate dehydratase [Methanoregula sp. PtaU1.Bin051]|nr:MAG: 3-dehydroquinate dehydratase [Methanoregula sp. PtaU1.Bin051]
MHVVAALTDPADAALGEEQGADMAELRLDLTGGDFVRQVEQCRKNCSLPIIATLRSVDEGGRFSGSADEWAAAIAPVIPLVDYVDVEQRFARHAVLVRAAGKKIIASHHAGRMVPLSALFAMERELRAFGDIPKIIVTPATQDDVVELIAFTSAATKPVCTGVMGSEFRYARAILPLFGSELVYCSVGTPTAEGQYAVAEFKALQKMLAP